MRGHHATGTEGSLFEVLATDTNWKGLVSKFQGPSERIEQVHHGRLESKNYRLKV